MLTPFARSARFASVTVMSVTVLAVTMLAACSSGGDGASGTVGSAGRISGKASSGSGSGGSGSGSGQTTLAPLTAIKLATTQAQAANSLAGTISIQVGGADAETLSGTMQIRLKPSLLLAENLNVNSGGQATAVQEILSTTAIYIQAPGLTVQPGKPWVEIPFSEMSGSVGVAFSQLIQDSESGNPLTQTQALTASKNARQVGTQVIGGVSTTHYAGTITAAEASAALPPNLQQVGSGGVSGDIDWNVWIDAQHNLRQLTETETVGGAPVTVTANVTAINPQATATLPPDSQVATLPASALSGGGI